MENNNTNKELTTKYVWICNECNTPNFTSSVSEDEIEHELHSCINCGCFEFHKKTNNKEIIKPPLGLKPRDIHEYHVKCDRLNDIQDAINRFNNANREIPKEWLIEYYELLPDIIKYEEIWMKGEKKDNNNQ